jgi:nitroreductase
MLNISTVPNNRRPDHPVDPLFPGRWSPRAMNGEPVSDEDLKIVFEAARWAPSSNNNQPWRFVYAHRDTPHWARLFGLLTKSNQGWCVNAGVLIVAFSRDTFDSGKPARTHSFDTGSAWMSMALQGSMRDLVMHGMQGFDYDRAKTELGIPDGYTVEAMIAVGHPGDPALLPESQKPWEFAKERHPVEDFTFEGEFRSEKT